MLDPETGLIMFLVGGVGTVVSFAAYKLAQDIGPGLEPADLLPAPPPNLSLPRFFYSKPELLSGLRR